MPMLVRNPYSSDTQLYATPRKACCDADFCSNGCCCNAWQLLQAIVQKIIRALRRLRTWLVETLRNGAVTLIAAG